MKRLIVSLFYTVAMVLAAPFVHAAPGDGLVAGESHYFGGNDVNADGVLTGACTYCHTPHSAQTQTLLWNQTATPAGTYGWEQALTTGGTAYADLDPATNVGPSIKCLSCHDGTATAGDLGHFNNQDPDTSGDAAVGPAFTIGNGATAGDELVGNHPVSMPYPLNSTASSYNNATNGPTAVLSDWIADPTVNGIRMFNDSAGDGSTIAAGAGTGGDAGIECSSCHDPHNGATVQDVFYLRGTVGDSANYICAKCHDR